MATIRSQLFFQSRSTGWSETYYQNGVMGIETVANLAGLAVRRMTLSCPDVSCIYQRISDDAVFRDSIVQQNVIVGNYGTGGASDVVYNALLVRLSSGFQFRRSLFLRGVPDILTVSQVFTPDAEWTNRFSAFRVYLRAGFFLKSFDRGATPVLNGTSIDATGLVTTLQPHGLAAGNTVRFRRVKTTPRLQGNQIVTTPITTNTFTVYNYGARGAYNNQFLVQQAITDLQTITSVDWERLVPRRTGRPFGQPLGKRRVPA